MRLITGGVLIRWRSLLGDLRPRECYILSDSTEKQSIIRRAHGKRRERELAGMIGEMEEGDKEPTR